MGIPINERITARREEFGLTDTFVAEKVGLSIDEYWDVEAHEDEIKELVELSNIKKICDFFKFDFFELFEMQCVFCEQGEEYLEEYKMARSGLLKKWRKNKGLTTASFSDLLDIIEDYGVRIEEEVDYLETLRFSFLEEISIVTSIPLQILLGVKCKKCER